MLRLFKLICYVFVLLASSLLSAGITYVAIKHGLGSSEAAGWVQAVGSIAALGIAIYVMSRQNSHSAKLVADADRLTSLRRAKSVYAVLLRTREQLAIFEADMLEIPQGAEGVIYAKRKFKVALDMLESIDTTLNGIPAFDLGSFHMADGALQLTQLAGSLKDMLRSLYNDPESAGSPTVCEIVHAFRITADDAMDKFQKGMKELEGQQL